MSSENYDNDDVIRNEQEATSLIAHSLNRERHGKRAYKLVESVIMGYGMMGDLEDSEDDDDYIPFDTKKQNNGGRKADSDADDDAVDDDEDDENDDDDDDDDDNDDTSSTEESNTTSEDDSDDDDDADADNDKKAQKVENNNNKKAVEPSKNKKKVEDKKKEGVVRSRQELAQDINVCSVCLQNVSRHSEDVAECDSCGIMVHELCYGVSGGDDCESIHSNASSALEEPWFCEPCTVGCKYPQCELCPNLGGIFKFTSQGRWIHMVCALYTKSIVFRDSEKLEFPSTSEISPSDIGKRTCSLCEDDRLANTGVCLKCDTGMCNTYFHITCAQKHGLLKRTDDLVDSIYFYADCNIHNKDKPDIRKKRQSYLVLAAKNKLLQSRFGDGSIEESILNDRNRAKLRKQSERFHKIFLASNEVKGSSSRTARALESSPSVVRRLCTKSEANGMIKYMNQTLEDMVDIRKKWYIPPAFSVEFVGYYLDRNERIEKFSTQSQELDKYNQDLKRQEANIRQNYDSVKKNFDALKSKNDDLRKKVFNLLDNCSNDKLSSTMLGLKCMKKVPLQQGRAGGPLNGKNFRDKEMTIKKCGTCHKTNDQYSLAFCDTCKLYYHLACLDPPLKRMPKKNRFGGWQCSNCTEKEEEDYASVMSGVSGPEDEASVKTMLTDHDSSFTEDDPKRKLRKNPKKTLPKEDEISPFSVKLAQANDTSGRKKRVRKSRTSTSGSVKGSIDSEIKLENGDNNVKPPKKAKVIASKSPKNVKNISEKKTRKSTDSDKGSAINKPEIVLNDEPTPKKIKLEDTLHANDGEKKLLEEVKKKEVHREPAKHDINEPISLLITPPKKAVSLVDCEKCHLNVPSKHCVKCDTCQHYYHFECLDPPLSKSPKKRGYTWNCKACEKNVTKSHQTCPNGVTVTDNNDSAVHSTSGQEIILKTEQSHAEVSQV